MGNINQEHNDGKLRLQKFLANFDVASRRKIEEMILAGRIMVDGKIAELGCRVDNNSQIYIDSKRFIANKLLSESTDGAETKLLIYNKPVGKICTKDDPQNRDTVYADLPVLKNQRWISIGRLDINTSGLLLFTNNGDFANKLMHPSNNYDREYLVRVMGEVNHRKIQKLLSGVMLDDGLGKFKKVTLLNNKVSDRASSNLPSTRNPSNQWYQVVLTEGRNREVRRLWEAVDCTVSRLMRIRFGHYQLPRDLAPGDYTYGKV